MEKYESKKPKRFQIPIGDISAIYLNRYSSELKYMEPWAQHDKSIEDRKILVNRNNEIERTELNNINAIKKNESKLK